jgi:hypothetical protein
MPVLASPAELACNTVSEITIIKLKKMQPQPTGHSVDLGYCYYYQSGLIGITIAHDFHDLNH